MQCPRSHCPRSHCPRSHCPRSHCPRSHWQCPRSHIFQQLQVVGRWVDVVLELLSGQLKVPRLHTRTGNRLAGNMAMFVTREIGLEDILLPLTAVFNFLQYQNTKTLLTVNKYVHVFVSTILNNS